ncbi:MAG: hypothetical protein ACUZ8I_11755 [Candidatus Scalindua sp.]
MPKLFPIYNKNKQRYLDGKFPWAQMDALKMLFISAKAKFQRQNVLENKKDPFIEKQIRSEQIFDTTFFKNSLTDLIHLAKLDEVSVLLSTQANLAFENTKIKDRKKIRYDWVPTDHNGLVKAINLANNIICQVGKKENVPVVDIYKSMSGKSEYFSDHVHLTVKGCEQLAELLSKKIVKLYFATSKE